MFERSLLEASPAHRWTAVVSTMLQCSIAAAIVATPLLHPAALIFHPEAPRIFLPVRPVPIPPPEVATAASASGSPAAAASTPAGQSFILSTRTGFPAPDTPPSLNPIGNMGNGDPSIPGIGAGWSTTSNGPSVALAPSRPTGPLRISKGVSTGLLLAPIKPIYPRIAITTRTEGTVVVEAIISKSGSIESAHATAGPPLLREAAIDAVRNARYSPYLLNGTPTEVLTTVTVQFRLAS